MKDAEHSLRQQLLDARSDVIRHIELIANPTPYKTLSRWDGRENLVESLNATLREIDEAILALGEAGQE
ncbi:MAG: hypothetical protein ABIW31_05275 [Novosphingobium sp.]